MFEVLIDDDLITALVWNWIGKEHGKSIVHFTSGEAFLNEHGRFSKETPIYLDWYLTPDTHSFELSRRISELGFTNILITTAALDVDASTMPWVKKVIDKSPPWVATEETL